MDPETKVTVHKSLSLLVHSSVPIP